MISGLIFGSGSGLLTAAALGLTNDHNTILYSLGVALILTGIGQLLYRRRQLL